MDGLHSLILNCMDRTRCLHILGHTLSNKVSLYLHIEGFGCRRPAALGVLPLIWDSLCALQLEGCLSSETSMGLGFLQYIVGVIEFSQLLLYFHIILALLVLLRESLPEAYFIHSHFISIELLGAILCFVCRIYI